MSTYPPVIGSKQARANRINKIYATTAKSSRSAIRPVSNATPKSKGPNMLKRMIKGLVNWSFKDDPHNNEITIDDREEIRLGASGIRFEVYRASGGTVVETRRNDRRTGDNIYELHVISSDQDVGQAIGQIITLEALKS